MMRNQSAVIIDAVDNDVNGCWSDDLKDNSGYPREDEQHPSLRLPGQEGR
jgi:hypothetical protein